MVSGVAKLSRIVTVGIPAPHRAEGDDPPSRKFEVIDRMFGPHPTSACEDEYDHEEAWLDSLADNFPFLAAALLGSYDRDRELRHGLFRRMCPI
jgi:hypothetical protein